MKRYFHQIFFMMFLLGKIDYDLVGMETHCNKEHGCLRMDSEDLFKAITNKNFPVVRLFIKKNVQGIDYDYLDSKSGETLLTRAIDVGNEAIVQFLLAKGASVHKPNDVGYTSIMKAVINNHYSLLRNLLNWKDSKKPCLDARSCHGETALMLACARGNFSMVELLLNAGADAAIENSEGLRAVDYISILDSDDICYKKSAMKMIYWLNTIQSK